MIPVLKNIDKDSILSQITEEEIFEHYLGEEVQYEKNILNTIRDETYPSVRFRVYNGILLAKDFGAEEFSGDCFKWAKLYYRNKGIFYDDYEILNKICEDLGLDPCINLSGKRVVNIRPERKVKEKTPAVIQIKARLDDTGNLVYTQYDLDFWNKFGVPENLLREFHVISCETVWVYANYKEVFFSSPSNPIFAYRLGDYDLAVSGDEYKIYQPNADKKYKWRCNSISIDDAGLIATKRPMILTKSKKDRLVLRVLGYESYSLHSESYVPDELPYHTDIVFYDNDFDKKRNAGQITAQKICSKFGVKNIKIPTAYRVKDISDFVYKYGVDKGRMLLNKLIEGK